jgi:hypothetical protein
MVQCDKTIENTLCRFHKNSTLNAVRSAERQFSKNGCISLNLNCDLDSLKNTSLLNHSITYVTLMEHPDILRLTFHQIIRKVLERFKLLTSIG